MKNVLILGATSVMAQAVAREFGGNGFRLMLAVRHPDHLSDFEKDFEIRYKTKPDLLQFDALDMGKHKSFYDSLPVKPDVVVCVFGYMTDQLRAQKDFTEARCMIDTNLTGAVSILEIVAQDMENRKQGCIIGVSSVAGDRGRRSNYIYGCGKAGFTAYLSGLRNRLSSSNVHVMTVKPGFVYTRMTDGMKLPAPITAKPEQVGRAIYQGYLKQKDVIYTLWMWRYIMMIIRCIPEAFFKRMKL